MLYREIIAICYEIYTKHMNVLSTESGSLYFNLVLVVHAVTSGL
jgi:hypothetical protein